MPSSEDRVLSDIEEWRRRAGEYRRMAAQELYIWTREHLLRLAQAYDRFANEAEMYTRLAGESEGQRGSSPVTLGAANRTI